MKKFRDEINFLIGFSLALFLMVVSTCAHKPPAGPPETFEDCRAELSKCGQDINLLLNETLEYKTLVDELRRECK